MALQDAKGEIDGAFTRTSDRGESYEITFGGATSFLRRRYTKDLTGIDLAVTGIPFNQATTNRPGTRLGPRAIREATTLQAPDAPYGWDVNQMRDIAMADYGDVAFDYGHIADFPATLQAHIKGILDQGAGCLALGGDHYVTYPILKAHAEKYGPLALLQFDAHTATWPDEDRTRITHGTMFYKAVKDGIIDVARSVQVGISTTCDEDVGINIIDARQVHLDGPQKTASRIKAILGNHPTYLTFDIDALDPAYAPGTGTPVWGGLTSAPASIILRDLAGINMVGAMWLRCHHPMT